MIFEQRKNQKNLFVNQKMPENTDFDVEYLKS